MLLTDTHQHIHSKFYELDAEEVVREAKNFGVKRSICVGNDLEDSKLAIAFAKAHSGIWASIGIHPHEASKYISSPKKLADFQSLIDEPKVVAVGECGLDYFYDHSPKVDQVQILRFQIELALQKKLPIIFHIREAFGDFWPIFDEYSGIEGVVHSFTATETELKQALDRGLYIGLNGIMTFTKKAEQLAAAKKVPFDRLVLETDAPFLTPAPYRGTIGQLKHVRTTAEFLANLRGESLEDIADFTTGNAAKLFDLSR